MFPGETSYNAALKWFHQSSCDLICKAFSFSFRKMEQPICISKAFQIHVPSLTQGLIRPQAQWASFPTWTNSYKLGLIASNYCSDFCARDACLIAIVALFLICQTRGSTQILYFTKAMPQCKNTALQGKVLHFIREVLSEKYTVCMLHMTNSASSINVVRNAKKKKRLMLSCCGNGTAIAKLTPRCLMTSRWWWVTHAKHSEAAQNRPY